MSQEEQIAGWHREIAGVMANTLRVPGRSCQICTRDIEAGRLVCNTCHATRSRHELTGPDGLSLYRTADLVVPLSYMVKYEQAYYDMFQYKDPVPSEAARRRLVILTWLFTHYHARCIDHAAGLPVTALALLPSLQGRTGDHPLEIMARFLPAAWQRISLQPSEALPDGSRDRRDPNPAFYRCDSNLADQHVVLFDDTWVSGGHAQGAAVCLRNAGAAKVTIVVLARMLDPTYSETAATFVKAANLPMQPYDLRICPATGSICP